MNNTLELKTAIEDIHFNNGIETERLVLSLKEAIASQFSDFLNVFEEDVFVEINEDYKVSLFLVKEVVEKAGVDDFIEISLADAKKIEAEINLGEKIKIPLNFDILNRKQIKNLNKHLVYLIKNINKELLYQEYKSKEGSVINGTFIHRKGRDMFIDLGKTEGRLSWSEQIPREKYQQGDKIRCYLKEVSFEDNRLCINLSRTDVNFVKKLFELEVPELVEGVVRIKSIVRNSGHKIKMTVVSNNSSVEPVGACVGLSGVRIKAVIKELGGEKIDVIPFTTNIKEFLGRAVQPGEVQNVLIIDQEAKESIVIVSDETYPLAIGRGGVNIKLASALTDWKINLKTVSQIQKNPEILKIFNKADNVFINDSDLEKLTQLDEAIIVKLLNSGVLYINELIDKSINELNKIENISESEAKLIREALDESVEVVEEDQIPELARQEYTNEFEDEISGVVTDEVFEEEIQQVEYLVCPSCSYEFEYTNQEKCPSCNVEFEFAEEEIVE